MYETATSISPDLELGQKKTILLAKAKLADRVKGILENKTKRVCPFLDPVFSRFTFPFGHCAPHQPATSKSLDVLSLLGLMSTTC